MAPSPIGGGQRVESITGDAQEAREVDIDHTEVEQVELVDKPGTTSGCNAGTAPGERGRWNDGNMGPMITGPGRAQLGATLSAQSAPGVDFAADRDQADEEARLRLEVAMEKFYFDRRVFRIRSVVLLLTVAAVWYVLLFYQSAFPHEVAAYIPQLLAGWFVWSVFLMVVTSVPGLFMCFPKTTAPAREEHRDDVALMLAFGGRAACVEEIPVLVEGLARNSALVPMEHIWLVMNGRQEDSAKMGELKNAIKAKVPNVNIVFVPRPSKILAYYWLSRHLLIGRARGLNNYKSVMVMDHDTSLTADFQIPHCEGGCYTGYKPHVKGFSCLLRTLRPGDDAGVRNNVLVNLQDLEYMGGSLNKVWQHLTGSVICPNGAFFLCQIEEFVASCEEHDDVFHGDDFVLGYMLTERLGHDVKVITAGAALTEAPDTLFYKNGMKGLFRQRGYSWDLVNFKLAKHRFRMAFCPAGRRGCKRSIIRRLDSLNELNSVMMDPFRIPLTIWCFWKAPLITLKVVSVFIVVKWILSVVTYVKFKDGFPKRYCFLTFLCIPMYQVLMQVMRLYGMFVYFTNFKAVNGNLGRRPAPIKKRVDLPPDPQQYITAPVTFNSQDLAAAEINWFSGQWGVTPTIPEEGEYDMSTKLNRKGSGTSNVVSASFQTVRNLFKRTSTAQSGKSGTSSRAAGSKTTSSLDTWVASVAGLQNWDVSVGPSQVYIDFAASKMQAGSIPPLDLCRQRARTVSFAQSGAASQSVVPGEMCNDPECLFCKEFGYLLKNGTACSTHGVSQTAPTEVESSSGLRSEGLGSRSLKLSRMV